MNIDSPEERTVLHYQLHRQVDLSYYLSGKNNATKRILYIVNVSNFSKKMSKGYRLEIPKNNITYIVTSDESCFGG